ncbi:MAG: LPS export ABC transporter periplasmic protein LptC [Synechococcales cyanobacterium M58_A2018_015]|nr:LPS export ABC transporter periplasmic protein LptC [Synechococcales cyanobacterium M58_A2018_015]
MKTTCYPRCGPHWLKSVLLLLLLTTLSTAGCRQTSRGVDRIAEDSSAAQDPDTSLTFNNLTLEQADDQGQTLWKIKAEQATYTPDQQTAVVQSPYGELYEEGKPVYRVQAKTGEVQQDGERILLKGEVIATDVESGAVLRGDRLEWRPQQEVITLTGNVRGSHPKVRFSANQARLFNRQQRIEVTGKVTALAEEPKLRLQGEQIVWRIKEQKVVSERPVQVQRVQGDQATDQASANKAEVNLATRVATLTQNAQLTLLEPPLQVTSNVLVWNVPQQLVTSDQPLTVVHRQQQITVTANRGRMELEPRVAQFNGNVRAVSNNQSQLTSDQLTWTIPTQQVVAEGNVTYVQPDPPATLRGAKAVGKLQDRTVVVSGGRVVTEIVPQQELIPGG